MKNETKDQLFEAVLGFVFLAMLCFLAIKAVAYVGNLEKRIQQLEQRK